jgi:hypothetical protein
VQSLTEKLKAVEKSNMELMARIELCEKQKSNKHSQLVETLQLNQG